MYIKFISDKYIIKVNKNIYYILTYAILKMKLFRKPITHDFIRDFPIPKKWKETFTNLHNIVYKGWISSTYGVNFLNIFKIRRVLIKIYAYV